MDRDGYRIARVSVRPRLSAEFYGRRPLSGFVSRILLRAFEIVDHSRADVEMFVLNTRNIAKAVLNFRSDTLYLFCLIISITGVLRNNCCSNAIISSIDIDRSENNQHDSLYSLKPGMKMYFKGILAHFEKHDYWTTFQY